MIDFGVDIKIDDANADQAIRRVSTELDRLERTGKAAAAIVSKGLADGTIQADNAAAATRRYAKALADAEIAAAKEQASLEAIAARTRAQLLGQAAAVDEVTKKARAAREETKGFLEQLGASKGLSDMVSEAAELVGNLGLAGTAIGGVVGHITGAIEAWAGWHVSMMAANDGLIEMRNRLRNVVEGQTALGFAMANTRAVADKTLTDVNLTVDVFSRLGNATRELGMDQQHVARLTQTLSELFQASGRSANENASATLQLSQALGSGRLQGDEFRSVAENAPQLLQVFAKELGVTTSELKKMSSEGKITTDVMIAGLDHMADSADRAFDRMEKTFSQKLRPLFNELQSDPLKLNRAASGNLSDASDIFDKGMESGLFRSSAAETAVFGESISFGNNQLAEFARTVQDTQAKIEQYRTAIEKTTTAHDSWANTKTADALLPVDQQVQQLVLHVQELNSPELALKGAQLWTSLKLGVEDFAKSAAGFLDDVHNKLDSLFSQNTIDNVTTGLHDVIETAQELAKKAGIVLLPKAFDPWAQGGPIQKGLSELEKLFHSIVDPLNHFNRDVRNLDTLFQQHRITLEQYNRELEKLKSHLEAADLAQTRFATHSVLGASAPIGPQTAIAAQLSGDGSTPGGFGPEAGIGVTGDANAQFAHTPINWADKRIANENALNSENQGIEKQLELVAKLNHQLEQQKKEWASIAEVMQQALTPVENALVHLADTGEIKFKELANSILHELNRIAAHKLMMSLIGLFSGKSAAQELYQQGLGEGLSPSQASVPHAARGFDGVVGGNSYSGDKVPFMAMVNSGERVTITPQFQMPSFEALGGGGGGGMPIVQNQNNVALHMDPRALTKMLGGRDARRQILQIVLSERELLKQALR